MKHLKTFENFDDLNENVKFDKILHELSYQRKKIEKIEINVKTINKNVKTIDNRLSSVEDKLVNIIKKNNLKH